MRTGTGAEGPLERRRDGPVLRLTLNRPEQFNPLSEAMLAALSDAFAEAALDPQVRVVVLGARGRAFCAGHDLREMRGRQPPELPADPHSLRQSDALAYFQGLFNAGTRLMEQIRQLPQPVIARVQGLATAGGLQLVAGCDLAVAVRSARFAASGIALGLFCYTPAVPLARAVGRKQAFEMLATGEFIDAGTACAWGLVNRVVEESELDAEVERLAQSIVAKPAHAVARGKRFFQRQLEMGTGAAYQLAAQEMALNLMDPAARERIDAFLAR